MMIHREAPAGGVIGNSTGASSVPGPVIYRTLGSRLESRHSARKLKNVVFCALLALSTGIALLPLISVFHYVLAHGAQALDWSFFTEIPKPVGEVGGGMANAVLGTMVLIGIAAFVGIPWGIAVALYLSEYGRGKRGSVVRFCVETLASIPSIVLGLFAYAVVVVPMGRFSALAGGIALGVLMIPIVARSSEELLKLVPQHIREAGLALGIPRWKVTLRVVLRGSLGGIATGVILAVARAAGETAPLLFTALNNQFWSRRLDQPIASLPVQIYTYAISPYEDWHRKAWAGALMLVMLVFTMNLATRLILRRATRGARSE